MMRWWHRWRIERLRARLAEVQTLIEEVTPGADPTYRDLTAKWWRARYLSRIAYHHACLGMPPARSITVIHRG